MIKGIKLNNGFLKTILTGISILLMSMVLLARPSNNFIHISSKGNMINCMYRSSIGCLWLGTTKGLKRLSDLKSLTINSGYYPEPLNQSVVNIQGTSDGCLWITLNSRKKYILNPLTHELTDFDEEWLESKGMVHAGYWEIGYACNGGDIVLILVKNQLYSFNVKTQESKLLKTFDDRDIGTDNDDNYLYIVAGDTIYSYDYNGRYIEKIKMPDIISSGFDINYFHIARNQNGDIWFSDKSLYKYDKISDEWMTINSNLAPVRLAIVNNDLYAATNTYGVIKFSSKGEIMDTISHDTFDVHTIGSNSVYAMYFDDNRNIWLSYSKGNLSVSTLMDNNNRTRHIQELRRKNFNDDIISIYCISNDRAILGTDGEGLYEVDLQSGIGDKIKEYSDNKIICDIFIDSRGRKWLGCYDEGVICTDGGKKYKLLPKSRPLTIAEDRTGYIYVGLLGNGIYRINPDLSGQPQHIDIGNHNFIQKIICDSTNNIYVAHSDGVSLIELPSLKVRHLSESDENGNGLIQSRDIRCMFKDSRNLIWIAGSNPNNSLEIFDTSRDKRYTIPSLYNIDFRSFIEDDNGQIWLASENRIYNITVSFDSSSQNYNFAHHTYKFKDNARDLDQNWFNYRSVSKTKNGDIVFGGANGYLVFNPEQLTNYGSLYAPKGIFTSLMVNSTLIHPGSEVDGNRILDKDISVTKKIALNHDYNRLIITFSPTNYESPLEDEYYYQLNGLNDHLYPVVDNEIELSNLPPGEYELLVKAANPNGTLTEPIAKLGIEIKSPWYKTVWAYLTYIALAIVLIWLIVNHYSRMQKQKLRVVQAEKEVERQHQLSEMKIRFFTNISHDFRTPLSLIITPLETYMNENSGSKEAKYFRPVYKNAVRLLNLVNQILDFRKLEFTGADLKLSYGDIVSFIKEVCSSFTIFSEDTDITLSVNADVEILNMYFDKDKLSKIMMNLLSNAFKFTARNGSVSVKIVDKDEQVEISISDTGYGISDEDKKHVFNRFYQAGTDNLTSIGSGIGLHIVKEFVELHKGNIRVCDNEPVGTKFVFTLPVVKTKPENGDVEVTPIPFKEPIEQKDDTSDRKTILLVEDNIEFIDFLEQSLSSDYNIIKAHNGKEALNRLNESSIDIIISDVMMDEMDGFELCKTVKNNISISHIPLILLTARTLVEDEMKGLEIGADDYITKPFNMSILRSRIKKLIDDNHKFHTKFRYSPDISPSEITITSLDEKFLTDALKTVENNISDPEFSVETLSQQLGVSRSHLYKKLSFITGKTPLEFIRSIRLKQSLYYLSKSQLYISEIAYKVGFNSPKLFAKYFKEEFGMLPSEYVRRSQAGETNIPYINH